MAHLLLYKDKDKYKYKYKYNRKYKFKITNNAAVIMASKCEGLIMAQLPFADYAPRLQPLRC